jgi:membrane-bound lytic murein transglycosylase D
LEGDTPEKIADRGNISLKKFLKYNDLEDNERIIPNQVYYLRKKDHKAQVAFHTVRGNESLWQVSQMYGINLDDLKEKNRITTVQRLQKGRLLYLIDTRSEKVDIQISTDAEQPQPPRDTNKNPVVPTPPKETPKPDNGGSSGVDKMPPPILVNPGTPTKQPDAPVTPSSPGKKTQILWILCTQHRIQNLRIQHLQTMQVIQGKTLISARTVLKPNKPIQHCSLV